jgi:hypothetical protein
LLVLRVETIYTPFIHIASEKIIKRIISVEEESFLAGLESQLAIAGKSEAKAIVITNSVSYSADRNTDLLDINVITEFLTEC